jgi:putative peptide zinc metalloprotease protein
VNLALAEASCTDCQTIAIALQIDLISTTAKTVTPKNAAVAVNYACTRCITVAVALQYVISVENPNQTPPDVMELIHVMERDLKDVAKNEEASLQDVVTTINRVLDQFRSLAKSLNDRRDTATESNSPDATPADFASPVGSPVEASSSANPSVTPSAEATGQSTGAESTTEPAVNTEQPTETIPTNTPTATSIPESEGTPGT